MEIYHILHMVILYNTNIAYTFTFYVYFFISMLLIRFDLVHEL